jgi:uncharacterized sulfatase
MPERRQAIVIMTDTQRWDMLGCYRDTGLQTPCLDRLAASGIRFERAYTCQPVCGPARAALFTGTFPHTNGSWTNELPLGANIKTVGQRLKSSGWQTAYIGKWHLDAHDYFGRGQCPDGWDPDYWYDMRNYLDELSPEDRIRSRDQRTLGQDIRDDFFFGHRCSNRAVQYLEAHRNRDFLLVVSYDEPHGPYLCPKRFYDRYLDYEFPAGPNVNDTLDDKPEHLRVWSRQPFVDDPGTKGIVRPDLFGSSSFVDYEIGRLLEGIPRHSPDALVIFTSDHGDMLRSHRIHNKGPAMFDEITRIPFLVRWPGHAPAGTVCPHPVSHIDLTPTLLDYFGLAVPETIEGESLLASFRDPAARPRDAVFIEYGRYGVLQDSQGGFQLIRCIFDGRFKLAVNLLTSDEFYDLREDPHELTNLIGSPAHVEARNCLHDRLLKWMNDTRDPFRGYYWERRPWRTDARPATWRYTGLSRRPRLEADDPSSVDYGTGLPEPRKPLS